MRLVYVANQISGTSGLERMISVQTNYFVRRFNYDVQIVLIEETQFAEERTFFEFDSKITLHYVGAKRGSKKNYFTLVRQLNAILPSLKPDIVNVCIDDILWLHIPIVLKKSYKIIYQRHSSKAINLDYRNNGIKTKAKNSLRQFLINTGGRAYNHFILLSEAHKRDWPKLKNIRVISNPLIIDANGSRALLDNKLVIAVGRHEIEKGFDMLLESWAKVIVKKPDWRLRIVGKRTTSVNLKQEANKLGVSNHVEFLDYSKQIKEEYLKSSMLVCSSKVEGFPLTIIEAMSLGVPVISFDCAYGPNEIISNEEDGILVPPNNVDSLANSILRLIENPELRQQMGQSAQRNIQRYAPDNIMEQWKSLFEELLD